MNKQIAMNKLLKNHTRTVFPARFLAETTLS